MPGHFYRFDKTQVESSSILKGENSWYEIRDDQNALVHASHVIGNGLGGTSTFHRSRDDTQVLFRMQPRRKVLNLTYFVSEAEDGPRLATIELFASRGMKVSAPDGRELFRVVDPQGKLDKFMQTALDGCCTEYAIVDSHRVIGQFERRERPPSAQPKRRGLVGKVLNGIFKGLVRDWCVELEDGGTVIEDHRPLLAAMILLMEQTIRLDQSA